MFKKLMMLSVMSIMMASCAHHKKCSECGDKKAHAECQHKEKCKDGCDMHKKNADGSVKSEAKQDEECQDCKKK